MTREQAFRLSFARITEPRELQWWEALLWPQWRFRAYVRLLGMGIGQ